jgi:hypothetical protein
MSLKDKFNIVKQEDIKRWLFEPINGHDSTSYTISFKDAPTEYDAWIAIWKAEVRRIENHKNKDIADEFEEVLLRLDKPTKSRKQRLLDEWNDISSQSDIFTVFLLVETETSKTYCATGALEITGLLASIEQNYDEHLYSHSDSIIRWKYYVNMDRAQAVARFDKEYSQDYISMTDVATANMIYYWIGAAMFAGVAAFLVWLMFL